MKFNPRQLCRDYDISFTLSDGRIIDADNWPENLIYKDLSGQDGVEVFYQYAWNDTTLCFFIESAAGRIKSLISRAMNYDFPEIIEHSDVMVEFLDDKPEDHGHPLWMVRSRVAVYWRATKLLTTITV